MTESFAFTVVKNAVLYEDKAKIFMSAKLIYKKPHTDIFLDPENFVIFYNDLRFKLPDPLISVLLLRA